MLNTVNESNNTYDYTQVLKSVSKDNEATQEESVDSYTVRKAFETELQSALAIFGLSTEGTGALSQKFTKLNSDGTKSVYDFEKGIVTIYKKGDVIKEINMDELNEFWENDIKNSISKNKVAE